MQPGKEGRKVALWFSLPSVTLAWRIHPTAASGQGQSLEYLKVPKQDTPYPIPGYALEFSRRERQPMLTKDALVRRFIYKDTRDLLFKIPKILINQLARNKKSSACSSNYRTSEMSKLKLHHVFEKIFFVLIHKRLKSFSFTWIQAMETLNIILFKMLYFKTPPAVSCFWIQQHIFKAHFGELFEKGLLFMECLHNPPLQMIFFTKRDKILHNVIFILFYLNLQAN